MPDALYTDKTPCVGLCSTVYGDQVCRGCKRFSHEIIRWNEYDSRQKLAVWSRLEQLLEQVVNARIEVVSGLMLRQALSTAQIVYIADQPLACQAYRLLVRADERLFGRAGLRLRADYLNWSLKQVRDDIDSTFFSLSEAYYQRHAAMVGGAPKVTRPGI